MILLVRAVALSCCALVAGRVRAEAPRPVDPAELIQLAGIIQQQELALVESKPDGTMRQVALVVFVRAPAASVHDLVADVGGYLRFVPNLKQADFKREADGRLVNTWRLELPISTFAGRDEYVLEAGATGAIFFHSLDTLATYRWDFIPVDGGTLLVQAGYADVLHANRFVRAFVRAQPPLEHGLALAAQYMLVSAVKKEAERRAGKQVARQLPSSTAALERLGRRGQVVLMRAKDDGRLAEVSVTERVFTSEARVRDAISDPGRYKEFIPGVGASTVTERSGDELTYSIDMALPILTWSTRYRMRLATHAFDGSGIEGDLRGAQYRWDLGARGPSETVVTYRAHQPLARSNILVKKLFEVDASLEYGLNVAFALLFVRSVRGRAEGWTTK